MRCQPLSLVPFFVVAASAIQDAASTTVHVPECTATSSSGSGAFFDLRPDRAYALEAESDSSHKYAPTKDYHAKGYDYGKNFTLNICGAVVDPVSDLVDVQDSLWANVSAYYTYQNKVYSIGSESMDLQSRGRKIVLQYTGGSPCGPDALAPPPTDTEPDQEKAKRDPQSSYAYDAMSFDTKRRKSTTISFLCDRDPGATQASVSFVGTDPDECAYFFEVRSSHACAHAEPHKPGSVGPGSIFGLILLIAVLVYLLGGIFYNRTVAHARGWRQLPNYSLWAGIWSFICDMVVILLANCCRGITSRRGYRHLNTSPSRGDRDRDAENRLIDQLDEEWED
ncbi:putative vacuolar sorting receptor [Thelonectria olida]|uniref:Vacuolar sorting receptor n=1 Tax=Thelonectria olida TaxID=1576542 RepID=A0A9P8WDN0_9HYPO|nr:putative vacuolar sorting receptor [Thelonectria olida]